MKHDLDTQLRASHNLERKVRLARWASIFEQLWVRLWTLFAVAALFALMSVSGIWERLGDVAHVSVLALFGAATVASLVYIGRVKWISRDDAIRRIERVSGVPHRPASSYEDTLTSTANDPQSRAIWQAHRARMADAVGRLKPGSPEPRTDKHDPIALRALLALGLVAGFALASDTLFERFKGAFQLASSKALASARLDAWATPPAYTGRPPVMLADGNAPAGSDKAITATATANGKSLAVPTGSVIVVRMSGLGSKTLSLEVTPAGGKPEMVSPDKKVETSDEVQEVRTTLSTGATLRALAGQGELAKWTLDVIPDRLPDIALTKKMEMTPRGSLKLIHKATDDYGVASAQMILEKVSPIPTTSSGQGSSGFNFDPGTSLRRSMVLRGPRPPYTRPPVLALKMPTGTPKEATETTYLELASHPWAGMRVKMQLEVKDVAGQVGATTPVEMIMPERAFEKPLAKAVVEQRRKLIDDPRYRDQVMTALDGLTYAPEGFIIDNRVYLGLRTVYHRLGRDRTQAGMQSTIEQLWNIALRIEDGDLSEAEKALRDAQDKLSKALQDGASEEEIQRLMKEMKEAFNQYLEQLAKKADKDNAEAKDKGEDGDADTLDKQELDEMMRQFEDAAKNGSREDAEKMLAEMRDVMERLKANKSENEQTAEQGKSQNLDKMMEKLANIAAEQQKLLDDTFAEQQGKNDKDPVKQGGSRGSQDAKNADKQKGKAERGKGKSGQGGEEGEEGEQGQGPRGNDEGSEGDETGQNEQDDGSKPGRGKGRGQKSLEERQAELRSQIEQLEKEMKEGGGAGDKAMREARDAMERAEDSLGNDDLDNASEDQGQALDKMRESAQAMAKQMNKSGNKVGNKESKDRDPMGRPQKTNGPDLGTSVKVPDKFDNERAREVLEEVRRRLGEPSRPGDELEYLERLQKRF
jgi:uncharacterized protein (TIGR02302 family)